MRDDVTLAAGIAVGCAGWVVKVGLGSSVATRVEAAVGAPVTAGVLIAGAVHPATSMPTVKLSRYRLRMSLVQLLEHLVDASLRTLCIRLAARGTTNTDAANNLAIDADGQPTGKNQDARVHVAQFGQFRFVGDEGGKFARRASQAGSRKSLALAAGNRMRSGPIALEQHLFIPGLIDHRDGNAISPASHALSAACAPSSAIDNGSTDCVGNFLPLSNTGCACVGAPNANPASITGAMMAKSVRRFAILEMVVFIFLASHQMKCAELSESKAHRRSDRCHIRVI